MGPLAPDRCGWSFVLKLVCVPLLASSLVACGGGGGEEDGGTGGDGRAPDATEGPKDAGGTDAEAPPEVGIHPQPTFVRIETTVEFSARLGGQKVPNDRVKWSVDPADDAHGTIDDSGNYKAPDAVPEDPEVTVRAKSQEAGRSFEISFRLADVSIDVTPGEASVRTSQQQEFSAEVSAKPDVEKLREIEWYVEDTKGGNDELGQIGEDGAYRAPQQPPESGSVQVSARSAVFSDVRDSADVKITAGKLVTSVSLEPTPDKVGLGRQIKFKAEVSAKNGKKHPNQDVRWSVNGTKGGGPEVGSISNRGVYQAPNALPDSVDSITIEAAAVADPSATAEVSFLLQKVTVDPEHIETDEPGTTHPLTVKAHFSDGTTADISKNPKTSVISPQKAVAKGTRKNGQVAIEIPNKTGTTFPTVLDKRLSPPALTKMRVDNNPKLTLEIPSDSQKIETITPGDYFDVPVQLRADRGVHKDRPVNVAESEDLSVEIVSGSGAVWNGEGDVPDSSSHTAWWHGPAGKLAFGEKPGKVRLRFKEKRADNAVEITARLYDVKMDVAMRPVTWGTRASDYLTDRSGNNPRQPGNPEWPHSDPPKVIFTPPDASRKNEIIHVQVKLRTPNADISTDKLEQLLGDSKLDVEDPTGKGRLLEAKRVFLGKDNSGFILGDPPGVDFARNELVAPFIRKTSDEQYVPDNVDVLVAGARFTPGQKGPQKIELTVPRTTVDRAEVELEGRLPKAQPEMDLPGFSQSYPDTTSKGVKGFVWTGRDDTPPGFPDSEEPAAGFEFELTGKRPDGSTINPDEDVVTTNRGKYMIDLNQVGTWTMKLSPEGYSETGPAQKIEVTDGPLNQRVESGKLSHAVSGKASGSTTMTLEMRPEGQPWAQWTSEPEVGDAWAELDAGAFMNLQNDDSPYQPSSNWSNNGTTLTVNCDESDPSKGQIRFTLAQGTPMGSGKWAFPLNGYVKYSVEVITPMHPRCQVWYEFDYKVNSNRTSAPNITPAKHVGEGTVEAFMAPPGLTVTPSSVIVPSDGGTETETFTVGGQTVLDEITGGASPSSLTFELVDSDGNSVSWANVKSGSIKQPNDYTLEFDMEVDSSASDFERTLYSLRIELGNTTASVPISFGSVVVNGPKEGKDDPVLPIPLNGTYKDVGDVGTMPVQLQWEGKAITNPSLGIRAVWENGKTEKLVGLQRNCTGGSCEVSSTEAFVEFIDDAKLALGASDDPKVNTIYMSGFSEGYDDGAISGSPRPDGVPDRISKEPGDIRLDLIDLNGNVVLKDVARTTVFNFVAKRKGKIRTKKPRSLGLEERDGSMIPTNFSHLEDAGQALSWWRDLEEPLPLETNGPVNRFIEPRTTAGSDLYVHIDRGRYRPGPGFLEMPFLWLADENGSLQINDRSFTRSPRDGRVREFQGEPPFREPTEPQAQGYGDDWKRFGLTLDGACFDPGWESRDEDQPPNDPSLFKGAGDVSNYTRKTLNGDPLLRAQGGINGGFYNKKNGGFTIVNRTAGVDFPWLNCSFVTEDSAESLEDITGQIDDLQDGTAEGMTYLEGRPVVPYEYPQRLLPFATKRDSKSWQKSAVNVGGKNAQFEMTTDPETENGEAIVDARLDSAMYLGPHKTGEYKDDSIVLTARKDMPPKDLQLLTHTLVSGTFAAIGTVSGAAAVGKAVKLGDLMFDAGLGIGMQVAMDASSWQSDDVSDQVGQGLTSAAPSTATKALKTALKKAPSRISQSVLQEVDDGIPDAIEKGNNTTKLRLKNLSKEIGADAAANVLASFVNAWIDQYLFPSDYGMVRTMIIENFGIYLPISVPTKDSACGEQGYFDPDRVRTIMSNQMVGPSLNTAKKELSSGLLRQEPEGNEEGDEYYEKRLPAPPAPSVFVAPGSSSGGSRDVLQTTHEEIKNKYTDEAEDGNLRVPDYRLCVGEDASVIPYHHTVATAIQRGSEEATGRIRIDRSEKVRLRLFNIKVTKMAKRQD